MQKPTLEYVMSAPLFGIFPNKVVEKLIERGHAPLVKETLNAYATILRGSVKRDIKNYDPIISVLFNGYTETNQIRNFEYYGKIGKNLYADSGGLQIVSRGLSVTDEIKEKIYVDQSYADYAMCFDVIRLKTIYGGRKLPEEDGHGLIQEKNERAMVHNKAFDSEEHKEAGRLTGLNIKAQVDSFRRREKNTKVIIIVQGNNKEHMLDFWNEIERQLDDDDYPFIGGYAVADTCIGNGQLESVEMLRAARSISSSSHPNIAQHFHLLGVGSILRMVPTIFLKQSGYLDKIPYISYDSSTHTSSFSFGTVRINGGSIKLGSTYNQAADEHFTNLYDTFSPFLKKYLTREQFINIIFGNAKKGWSISDINARAAETNDPRIIAIAYMMKTAHTFYQVKNFCGCIDGLFDNTFKLDVNYANAYGLRSVRDEKDIKEWIRLQDPSTKRIKDLAKVKSIMGAFG